MTQPADPTGGAAEASSADLRSMLSAVRDYAIFTLDPSGRVTSWNAGAAVLKGWQASEILGQHISVFYTDEDRAIGLAQALLERAALLGSVHHEGLRRRKDGSLFWADALISAIRDERGALIGFAKVTRDLSERKQMEDELRRARAELEERVRERTSELARSEARYRMIVESTSQGILMLDHDDKIVFANARMGKLLGSDAKDLVGQRSIALAHESELGAAAKRSQLRRAGAELQLEVRLRHRTGAPVWVSATSTPIFDAAGAYQGAISMYSDVSERRSGDEARRRLAAILATSHDAIWSADPDGKVTGWNPAAERLFGYAPAEIVGKSAAVLCPPERADETRSIGERLRQGEPSVRLETKRLRKDRSPVEVELVVSLVVNALGQPEHNVVARELSPRR